MSDFSENNPLGKKTEYPSTYSADLLFPIARDISRESLGVGHKLPFFGYDIWTAYELSWLNEKGKPQVAIAEFSFPCSSPSIIESKSFKLYLNSFNQTKFSTFTHVETRLIKDLSAAAGAPIIVTLKTLQNSLLILDLTFDAICLDDLDIEIDVYQPESSFLHVDKKTNVEEKLCTHLLKTNCPVTGQPDWASVIIEYAGNKIEHENLLRYLISFREHQDFHEHCVERIFVDLIQKCKPKNLSVYARYTRRGGLDINPFRSTLPNALPSVGRLIRQ